MYENILKPVTKLFFTSVMFLFRGKFSEQLWLFNAQVED